MVFSSATTPQGSFSRFFGSMFYLQFFLGLKIVQAVDICNNPDDFPLSSCLGSRVCLQLVGFQELRNC